MPLLPWPSYPVDTQWPSIAGGICTVILAPLWRCLSMWWHWDSLNALQALFSKDLGCDLLSGWRRAEPSPSPEKEQWKLEERRAKGRRESGWRSSSVAGKLLHVGNAHLPQLHQALSLPLFSKMHIPKWEMSWEIISQERKPRLMDITNRDMLEVTWLVPSKAWAQIHVFVNGKQGHASKWAVVQCRQMNVTGVVEERNVHVLEPPKRSRCDWREK